MSSPLTKIQGAIDDTSDDISILFTAAAMIPLHFFLLVLDKKNPCVYFTDISNIPDFATTRHAVKEVKLPR